MYYKLSEADKKWYEHAKELTCTNYEPIGDFLEVDALWSMIQDLICEVESKNDEIDRLNQDIQDNYQPIPLKDLYEADYEN